MYFIEIHNKRMIGTKIFMVTVFEFWFQIPSKTCTSPSALEGGIYDKYNSDIACSLPGVHKLYNKLIAYQIFEIGFDRRRQCLKIDFEDFNETMAILKKSNWV